MRRGIPLVLATVTALSLSTGVAAAKPSSEVGIYEASAYVAEKVHQEAVDPGTGVTSSFSHVTETIGNNSQPPEDIGEFIGDWSALLSSAKNDAANGYKLGTTYEIVRGTGIAVTVIGILLVIAKVANLPLPF